MDSNTSYFDDLDRVDLPNTGTALVLGIISLVMVLLCFCTYVSPILGVILSVIGFVYVRKDEKSYNENTEKYTYKSYTQLKNAKIINIISLVLNIILSIAFLIIVIFYASLLANAGIFNYQNYQSNPSNSNKPSNSRNLTVKDSIEQAKDSIYEYKRDSVKNTRDINIQEGENNFSEQN